MFKKAVFLDRDGVVTYDVGYFYRPEQVKLLPGVETLRELEKDGFLLVIVSNQSVVARRMLSKKGLWEIDKLIRRKLKRVGVNIKASYYCPHHPDFAGPCQCRKPKPGLFLKAIKELNIDPRSSFIIGDKPSDLEAGKRAGVGMSILVKRNSKVWDATKEELVKIKLKAKNLAEAIKIILEKNES